MKRISLALLGIVCLATSLCGETFDGMEYAISGDVVPGQWNTQYDKCVMLAREKNLPLVVFWGRRSCTYCKRLAAANATSKVVNWRKERGYVFLLGIEGESDGRIHSLAKEGKDLPFVGFYQGDRNGDGKMTASDSLWRGCGRSGKMPVTKGSLAQQFMDSADLYLQESGGGDTPEPEPVANITKTLVFGGFATSDASNLSGGLELKVAKGGKATATVQLPADSKKPFSLKKYKFTGALAADGTATLACSKHVGQMVLRVSKTTASGTVEHGGRKYDCSAALTSDAAQKAMAAFKDKVWVLSLRTSSRPESFLNGYSALSVSANKSGKAKVSGFLADGTKVSVSVQGRLVDGALVVPVSAPLYKNKAGGFCLTLRLGASGVVKIERASKWISLVNGVRTELDWGEAVGFAAGPSLRGSSLKFAAADFPAGLDPDSVFSEKLSYNAKTGLFKGSFKVLPSGSASRSKKTATVNGAVVDGSGYGSAVIKKYGALPVTVAK